VAFSRRHCFSTWHRQSCCTHHDASPYHFSAFNSIHSLRNTSSKASQMLQQLVKPSGLEEVLGDAAISCCSHRIRIQSLPVLLVERCCILYSLAVLLPILPVSNLPSSNLLIQSCFICFSFAKLDKVRAVSFIATSKNKARPSSWCVFKKGQFSFCERRTENLIARAGF
jgi:hypothetical protein